ncbi:hypothetical protein SAMN04487950_2023 [Halogranum rubrum]|uniref:Uncharacterized protein n=1 Tax=Halogranum rubrum TaxID=553466 RepID=A0A1I4E9Y5_9EURY|nr:ribonuclease BN [Halogranum rubrum]SFL02572.1 hypothetical protein SAMN04487950_2023 [Halogranum rubrum]
MTSLSEAYTSAAGQSTPRRLYLGVALFLVGALLVITGIVVTTTNVLRPENGGYVTARLYGGTLAGIGVPAVLLGVFTVLPAARQTRAAAIVGASISLLGVALFWHAYPCGWIGAVCPGTSQMDLTLPTVGVYFLGTITAFWCLFAGVANFKTRNSPGGTVKMEVTRQGETRVIEVPAEQARSFSGVGFFGDTPDGNVETQTNGGATVSDGGAEGTDIRSPLDDAPTKSSKSNETNKTNGPTGSGAEVWTDEPASPRSAPSRGDAYCGSCAHFQYVRTDEGMAPYCGYHGELMDDMTACQEWTPQNQQ